MIRGLVSLVSVSLVVVGCAQAGPPESKEGATWRHAHALEAELAQAGGAQRFVLDATVSHASGRFSHLEGRIAEPGLLSQRVAITANGVEDLEEVRATFRTEHVSEWGSVRFRSAQHLVMNPGPPEQVMPFSVWYRTAERGVAEDAIRRLDPDAQVFESPNAIVFRAPRGVVLSEVARAPWAAAVLVSGDENEQPVAFNVPGPGMLLPNQAITSNSDLAFTLDNIFGTAVRVGTTETPGACQIWDQHEAFGARTGTITYRVATPIICAVDMDCQTPCGQNVGSGVLPGVCRNGRCVAQHATQVASRILSNHTCTGLGACSGGKFMAAAARLFIANSTPSAGASASLLIMYNWLWSQQVRLVNESWGSASNTFSARSVFNDWYTRYRGTTFVHAAGNRPMTSLEPLLTRGCMEFNSICVGSFEGNGPSRNFLDYRLPATTTWTNPIPNPADMFEIEKPDVVANGNAAHVANTAGTSTKAWTFSDGTSFAAPVVTGLIAQLTHKCWGAGQNPGGGSGNPALIKAMLMATTFAKNQLETASDVVNTWPATCPMGSLFPKYPSADAQFGCDYKAGAGAVDAKGLDIWCGGPSNGTAGSTTKTGTTTPGSGTALPSFIITAAASNYISTNHSALTSGNARQTPGPKQEIVYTWNNVTAGSRIRATFTYYSCPVQVSGSVSASPSISELDPAVNLDFALCGKRASNGANRCLFISEQGNSTSEGFDVTIDEAFTTLQAILIKPGTWTPCSDGTAHPASNEPWAFAAVWW